MNKEVRYTNDKEHLYIEGKQFVSLKRFHELLSEIKHTNTLLDSENQRLTEENCILKNAIKLIGESM